MESVIKVNQVDAREKAHFPGFLVCSQAKLNTSRETRPWKSYTLKPTACCCGGDSCGHVVLTTQTTTMPCRKGACKGLYKEMLPVAPTTVVMRCSEKIF